MQGFPTNKAKCFSKSFLLSRIHRKSQRCNLKALSPPPAARAALSARWRRWQRIVAAQLQSWLHAHIWQGLLLLGSRMLFVPIIVGLPYHSRQWCSFQYAHRAFLGHCRKWNGAVHVCKCWDGNLNPLNTEVNIIGHGKYWHSGWRMLKWPMMLRVLTGYEGSPSAPDQHDSSLTLNTLALSFSYAFCAWRNLSNKCVWSLVWFLSKKLCSPTQIILAFSKASPIRFIASVIQSLSASQATFITLIHIKPHTTCLHRKTNPLHQISGTWQIADFCIVQINFQLCAFLGSFSAAGWGPHELVGHHLPWWLPQQRQNGKRSLQHGCQWLLVKTQNPSVPPVNTQLKPCKQTTELSGCEPFPKKATIVGFDPTSWHLVLPTLRMLRTKGLLAVTILSSSPGFITPVDAVGQCRWVLSGWATK